MRDCRASVSSGSAPRKRRVCSASESHSNSMWTVSRNSSAWNNQAQKTGPLSAAEASDSGTCQRKGLGLNSSVYHRHFLSWSKLHQGHLSFVDLRKSQICYSLILINPKGHSEYQFLYYVRDWLELSLIKKLKQISPYLCLGLAPKLSLTCFKACSRRLCLETESLQTVSQRVLSSCSCPFTQVVSSRLFSISSLPDRFRTWTVPVRFPSSFWKT